MSSVLDQTKLTSTALQRVMGVPPGGPKMVPIDLDFTTITQYSLDYQNMQARNLLEAVQTIWVDNFASAAVMVITIPGSRQTLRIPAGVQGYFPCLCPNPPRLTFASTGGVVLQVALLNFQVWS